MKYTYTMDGTNFPRGVNKGALTQVAEKIVGVRPESCGFSQDGKSVEIDFGSIELTAKQKLSLDRIARIHGANGRKASVVVRSVSDLPEEAMDGDTDFVIDGRKSGETARSGTGCPVYFSAGAWRRYSDDTPVEV